MLKSFEITNNEAHYSKDLVVKLMNKLRESKRAQQNQSNLGSEYGLLNHSIHAFANHADGYKHRHHTMSMNIQDF